MSCTCRMAPLRSFLRGLAQVHRLDAPSSPLVLAASSHLLMTTRPARSFHRTRQLNQQDAEAPDSSNPRSTNPTAFNVNETKAKVKDGNATVNDAAAILVKEYGTSSSSSQRGPSSRKFDSDFKKGNFGERYQTRDRHDGSRGGSFRQRTDFQTNKKPVGAWGSRSPSNPASDPSSTKTPPPAKRKEDWRAQKEALKAKFPEGWRPRKRLSPDALAGIRALNAQFPDIYTSQALSEKFEVSVENIRRILRSKWTPSVDEEQERQERWHRRGQSVWENRAAMGIKPPRKWRDEGINVDPKALATKKFAMARARKWEEEENERYRQYREGLKDPSKRM